MTKKLPGNWLKISKYGKIDVIHLLNPTFIPKFVHNSLIIHFFRPCVLMVDDFEMVVKNKKSYNGDNL